MKVGQVSRSFFCPFCGAPAVGFRTSRLYDPLRAAWGTSCAHAARPERMGPKRHAEVVARHEARQVRERERRRYIASCAGEPVLSDVPVEAP